MTPRNQKVLAVLAIVVVLAAGYVLKFGLYSRYFDIQWDEEVQLHDGRMIVVHVKRTFERLGKFERWHGVQRDTEISFDAGGTIGRFTKKFQRYDVDFLHEKGGQWYIYLLNTTGTPPVKLVEWSAAFLILKPSGELEKARSWDQLPTDFLTRNIMPPSPDASGISKFNNKTLTLADKREHWNANPAGAGDDEVLRRPIKSTTYQGVMK
jgi:hypothetical protein